MKALLGPLSLESATKDTRAVYAGGAILAVAVGAGVVAAADPFESSPATKLVVGTVFVVAACMPAIWRLRTYPLDVVGLFGLACSFYLGFMSLSWLGSEVALPGPGLSREIIADSLPLVALGLGAFSLGARLLGPAKSPQPLDCRPDAMPSNAKVLMAYCFALVGVGIGLTLSAVGYIADPQTTERLGAFGETFRFLASLGNLVVLCSAFVIFLDNRRSLIPWLALFVVLQIAIGFILGLKSLSIQPLLYCGVAYFAARGRIPWRSAIALVFVLFFVILPLNSAYRTTLRGSATASVQDALTGSLNAKSGSLLEVWEFIDLRFRLIDSFALIKTQTPKFYPWGEAREYLLIPAMIAIPRALWPDKPIVDPGGENSRTYWQIPADQRTSTPPTIPGDLYRHFGTSGVVFGMLAWGALLGWWARFYAQRAASLRLTFVAVVFAVLVIPAIEVTIPSFLSTSAKDLAFTALVAWLLFPGTRIKSLRGHGHFSDWLRRGPRPPAGVSVGGG